MVQRILHLAEAPTPADAADALALAITHVWRPNDESGLGQPPSDAKQKWMAAEAATKKAQPTLVIFILRLCACEQPNVENLYDNVQ